MLERVKQSAYDELATFIQFKATSLELQGWRYRPTSNPTLCTWELLQKSKRDRVIWVSSDNSEQSIYTPDINILFRFYHDYLHLTMGLDFSYDSEIAVAKQHYKDGIDFGLSYTALKALRAETVGQLKYHRKYGEHVVNQRAFADSYIDKGENAALSCKH